MIFSIVITLTIATPFVVREYKAWFARALEAAWGVGAGAKLAEVGLFTFINI